MLTWMDLELARLRQEELLREAAADRLAARARGAARGGPGAWVVDRLAVLHRRLHELDGVALAREAEE